MSSSLGGWTSAAENIKILIVDGAPDGLQETRRILANAGYEVWTADSGEGALSLLEQRGLPHLAIVEINLPGIDGIELCEKIQDFIDLPVIVLTAVRDTQVVVEAIEKVAEDYVTKPFEPAELVARVERLLRRIGDFSYTLEPQVKVDHRLSVEFGRRFVVVDGKQIELTPIETKLLYILMRNAGRTVLSDYLIRRLWPLSEIHEDALRTHVYRLRKKIEISLRQPRYVLTRRGLGYSFPKI